ncbi:methionine ABC transporter substrate-binding, putative [Babesia ovis]|uniref:Methionine ABC transporter substrate-binding, putative n=1 Tax=Babesia ovis TaxID=5869 RepID=A0A9W5WTM2_BABOV|nr:methionine ABC transporter substrate-binding, putative [Babesia ovis]
MKRNVRTIEEKTKQLRLEALRYCETADRNLKLALLQAEQRVKQAQYEFLEREKQLAAVSKGLGMTRITRILEIAKLIVDQKPVDMTEMKLPEIEAMQQYVVPYVQQMKVVELRQKEFELVKEKIDLNAVG